MDYRPITLSLQLEFVWVELGCDKRDSRLVKVIVIVVVFTGGESNLDFDLKIGQRSTTFRIMRHCTLTVAEVCFEMCPRNLLQKKI